MALVVLAVVVVQALAKSASAMARARANTASITHVGLFRDRLCVPSVCTAAVAPSGQADWRRELCIVYSFQSETCFKRQSWSLALYLL